MLPSLPGAITMRCCKNVQISSGALFLFYPHVTTQETVNRFLITLLSKSKHILILVKTRQ